LSTTFPNSLTARSYVTCANTPKKKGFNALTKVGTSQASSITITLNPKLETISGFNNISVLNGLGLLGGITVTHNRNLFNISGFNKLVSIGVASPYGPITLTVHGVTRFYGEVSFFD
jgi:hypothetical protein